MADARYIFPDQWVELLQSYRRGELETASRLESIILPMTRSIMKHGPGGIKAAMDMLGYFGRSPLSPLKSPSTEGLEKIIKSLFEAQENQKFLDRGLSRGD